MRFISPMLSASRAAAGRKGGYTTFFKYKRAGMVERGRLGGRPRLLTLEELLSQTSARGETKNEKGRVLTDGIAHPRCRRRFEAEIKKERELAVTATAGSPERSRP